MAPLTLSLTWAGWNRPYLTVRVRDSTIMGNSISLFPEATQLTEATLMFQGDWQPQKSSWPFSVVFELTLSPFFGQFRDFLSKRTEARIDSSAASQACPIEREKFPGVLLKSLQLWNVSGEDNDFFRMIQNRSQDVRQRLAVARPEKATVYPVLNEVRKAADGRGYDWNASTIAFKNSLRSRILADRWQNHDINLAQDVR